MSYFLSVVVRDRRVHVVSYMGASNVVMQEIDQRSIRPIDGMESTFGPSEFFLIKMRHIDISVLEPGVENKPHVHK